MFAAAQRATGVFAVFSAFAMIYGFTAMFILSSLVRNRREARPDAPILAFAGRGLMAASAAGAGLVLSAISWTSLAH